MSFLKDFKDLKKDISASVEDGMNMEQPEAASEKEAENTTAQAGTGTVAQTAREKKNTEGESIVAAGMVIEGNIHTEGSLAVYGEVRGNIICEKKLIVTGEVQGNLTAGEIFVNKARVTGQVESQGNLKIGKGSVILGDVYGKTAVIAGAVKGEVDIHGPLIIDNTAVIRGNIKSASVQINNGAVMEGYCTQCYHDVDVQSIFEVTFPEGAEPEKENAQPVQPQTEQPEETVQEIAALPEENEQTDGGMI